MMIEGLPLTFLWQGQICVPMHLYGENVEKSFFQNVLMGPSVKRMFTICPNGFAPLIKMADVPIYGNNI